MVEHHLKMNCNWNSSTNTKGCNMEEFSPYETQQLMFAFYSMKTSEKWKVVENLGLLDNSDRTTPSCDRFKDIFVRAGKRGKHEQLLNAIKNKS